MNTKVYNLLFLLVFLLIMTSCAKPQAVQYETGFKSQGTIYSLKEARIISRNRLLEQLEGYPVIFIGDFHNNDTVHKFTADLIGSLGQKYTLHLANEWFAPEQNEKLSLFVNNQWDEKKFMQEISWKDNIGYAYENFKPIYQSLKDVNGKMYGINLSKAERKKISLLQIDIMSEDEKNFLKSLDLNTTAHRQMIFPFLNHCHMPLKGESEDQCLKRMYRVQVAWDEKMGQESALLAQKVLQSPKEKLIVFIGAMHLESGLGANMRFARYSNKPFVTLLPCFETKIEPGRADFIYYVKPLESK
ncbi:ChaN family lipoprotein [Campylobacterota bacterium]